MKKFFVIPVILAVVFAFRAYAAEAPTGTKSEAMALGIESIYVPCEDPTDEYCVAYPASVTQHPDPSHKDHELGLSAENLPPDTEMYIVGCIGTESGGTHCTTGSDSLDAKLNAYPYGDRMVKDPSYQFVALENPVKTDAAGALENVIVRSFTSRSTTHSFFAYYIGATGGGPEGTAGPSPTTPPAQHQDKLEFDPATPAPTATVKHAPVRVLRRNSRQDPEGRFFDAKSLEPIPTGEVALLDDQKKMVTDQELVNPQRVKSNGEFNFWVKNGTYYLDLTQKPDNYGWPLPLSAVHSSYAKAYYCDPDVKDGTGAGAPLYLDQYPIVEKDKLVHCDVPLDPGANPPYRSDVATVEFSASKTHQSKAVSFSGKVTHPLTIVTLKGGDTGKVAATASADKRGFWDITVADSQYPFRADGAPDTLIASYQKVDLTNATQSALVQGPVLEPILSYLEGYAYDSEGKPLSRARAGFRQAGTDEVVYVTTTNVQGFFKIPTRYLPTFAYELVFLPAGSAVPVAVSTARFASQNAKYLEENKLNLLSEINDGYISPKSIPSQPATKSDKVGAPAKPSGKEAQQPNSENLGRIFSTLFVLLLLFAVGGGVGWVIYRNKTRQEPPPVQNL